MSGTRDEFGLIDRRVFDRVVAAIPDLIKSGSFKFRFSRGGAFRASVTREKLNDVLYSLKMDKQQFDSALAEVIAYLNAIVFKTTSELTEHPYSHLPGRVGRPDTDASRTELLREELRARVSIVQQSVPIVNLTSRARMRRYAASSTLDSMIWSITRASLVSPDNESSKYDAAGITLSLYRAAGGRSYAGEFSVNFAELAVQQTDVVSFIADEEDIDELLDSLIKIKQMLGERK